MLYEELQKSGKKLLSYDKHGQGPYNDAYQGITEWWAVGNDIYMHGTNDNSLAYTGRTANTEYVGTVKDLAAFEKDLTAKSDLGFYYDMLYANVKSGEY